VFIGLAWWTKYNGWLPLAILAAALPLLWMLLRVPRSQAVRWIGQFAVTAVIAAAVWSPYFLSLQSHGGYGPIATNHEKYIVGLSGWLNSASRHLASQHVMESYASWLAPAVALMIAATCFGTSESSFLRLRGSTYIKLSAWALFMAALAWLSTSFLLLGAAALVGLALRWAVLMKTESRDQHWNRSVIGLSLVAVWWCGLLVATPCYQPYPRLVLPWLISTWLAAAVCGDEVLRPLLGERQAIARGQYVLLVVGVVIVIATTIMFRATTAHLELPPALSTDRQQLVAIAKQAHARLETSGVDASLPPSAPSRAVYVHGEPALFFQLAAAGEPIVVPTQDVPPAATFFDQPIPTYLVVGPHTRRDPAFLRQWKSAHPNWNLIKSWPYEPSALVWLDLNDPRLPKKASHAEHDRIDLYRLK
jgi:hypothetical protein